jgi:4-amino-4-deoxy-L-arabinose transferase-like glycosyltransferase
MKDRLPVLLAVLALVVYLPGSTWGIPHVTGSDRAHAWGNDDQVPLAPLAEMHNTFVVAKPDRNVAYPWFHYFLVAAAYSPYLLYLVVTGGLRHPDSHYPFGLADPAAALYHLSLIGRSVTLVLAVATVLGMYFVARYLWDRTAGVFASLFTMLLFHMAYYARLGNPDVPSLGWTALGLAAFALALRQGLTPARGAWFAAFTALALATKLPIGSFVLLPFLLLWRHLRNGQRHRFFGWQSIWAAPAMTTLVFLGTYVVASGIVVDPTRYTQHVAKARWAATQATHWVRYPPTASGYLSHAGDLLGHLVDVMTWPGLVAAGVGLVLAARRDPPSLCLALSSVGFFAMLMPMRLARIHYLLPVAVPLTAFAGYAFSRGLKAPRGFRAIVGAAAIVAVGYPLLHTVDLTHDMIHDSRYATATWLDRHTRAGDRLLHFGAPLTLPSLRADVQTVSVPHRRDSLHALREHQAEVVIVMPLDFNEDRRRVEWRDGPHAVFNDYLTPEAWAGLTDGSLGYRLVARFQSPRLLPWLPRPFLTYATVNPPIHVFLRDDRAGDAPRLEPWRRPPHYPTFIRVREPTVEHPPGGAG